MNKFKKCIISILIFIFILNLCGCSSKYNSTDCEAPFVYPAEIEKYFYKPDYESFNYDKKIEENGLVFYYESGLSGRKIDSTVDAIKKIQAFCDMSKPVFITEKSVTYVGVDGLWVNCKDSAELIGAVILESTNQNKLPFGFFAGISANLLEEVEFTVYSESRLQSRLEEYPYIIEFQYPFFITSNTNKNERNTAWNFAFNVGKFWLMSHTIGEVQAVTNKDLQDVYNQFGVKLPFYRFSVGDNIYPVQVSTNSLNYYFAYNFKDCELTENYFSFEYPTFTKFINENEVMITEITAKYGYYGFPQPVDCFFGKADEFNQYSIGHSEFSRNTISCYTVSIFGHEIMHWIQFYTNYDYYGELDEAVHSVLSLKYSSFASSVYYRDYKHEYKDRYMANRYKEEEKEALKFATEIYNKKFGKCSFSKFNINRFIDATAYYYIQKTSELNYINMIMAVSFLSYIYENYGIETMMAVNRREIINGKTFKDYINEWNLWLKNHFSKF